MSVNNVDWLKSGVICSKALMTPSPASRQKVLSNVYLHKERDIVGVVDN